MLSPILPHDITPCNAKSLRKTLFLCVFALNPPNTYRKPTKYKRSDRTIQCDPTIRQQIIIAYYRRARSCLHIDSPPFNRKSNGEGRSTPSINAGRACQGATDNTLARSIQYCSRATDSPQLMWK